MFCFVQDDFDLSLAVMMFVDFVFVLYLLVPLRVRGHYRYVH